MKDEIRHILSDASGNPSWLDIPSLLMLQLVPEVSRDKDLCGKIAAYHSIPKDDYHKISDRIASLAQISRHIEKQAICGEISKTLKDMQETADRKMEYLSKIQALHEIGILVSDSRIYDAEKIRDYFERGSEGEYIPVTLNNQIYYDSANARFWGEYWLEIVDPCHRPLEHYKDKWLQESVDGDGKRVPFFMWLEKHEVSPYHKKIALLTTEELEKLSLEVKNGKLFTGAGAQNRLLTTDHHWETLFVITPDKKIFSCPATGDLRHISLSSGKPLIGVGSFKVKDGLITELHSDSGHYRPTPEMANQTIKVLEEMGIKIAEETTLYYFDDFKEVKTTVGDFLNKHTAQMLKKQLHKPKL